MHGATMPCSRPARWPCESWWQPRSVSRAMGAAVSTRSSFKEHEAYEAWTLDAVKNVAAPAPAVLCFRKLDATIRSSTRSSRARPSCRRAWTARTSSPSSTASTSCCPAAVSRRCPSTSSTGSSPSQQPGQHVEFSSSKSSSSSSAAGPRIGAIAPKGASRGRGRRRPGQPRVRPRFQG